jgi:hypothetical protein
LQCESRNRKILRGPESAIDTDRLGAVNPALQLAARRNSHERKPPHRSIALPSTSAKTFPSLSGLVKSYRGQTSSRCPSSQVREHLFKVFILQETFRLTLENAGTDTVRKVGVFRSSTRSGSFGAVVHLCPSRARSFVIKSRDVQLGFHASTFPMKSSDSRWRKRFAFKR